MKEFSIEKALYGAPVCTRDGHKVTLLTMYEVESENLHEWQAYIAIPGGADMYLTYSIDGKTGDPDSANWDLMMMEEE